MARKMVLVPENYLSTLHQYQKVQTTPLVKTLGELDTEMERILSRKDITDDVKVKLYNQAMQKYLEYEKQRKVKEPIAVKIHSEQADKTENHANSAVDVDQQTTVNHMDDEILNSVPKLSRNKAQLLLNKLKQNKDVMFWNERGELTYDGKPVPGTNIVDLIRDTMSARKNFQPTSRELFSRGLARVNTPLNWIGNDNRKNAVERYTSTNELTNDTSIHASSFTLSPPPSANKSKPSKKKKKNTSSTPTSAAIRWIQY